MMKQTAIVPGSLAAVTQRDNVSLAESFLSVDAILVVDMSGSMACNDAPGGLSRYEAAERELHDLQQKLPGKVAVVAFSDQAEFCPGGVPPRYGRGTNLAGALRLVKPADGTGVRFILISDGHPDSEEEALAVARTFQSRIDVVYIGPEDDRMKGREFLQRLAAATGGQFARSAEPGMLAEPVQKLLAAAH